YTVLPSAENAYSLASPNGLEGMSPSMPRLRRCNLPGLPAASRSAMNNCERRPSDQVSQWRTNNLSYSTPLAFSASRASSLPRVHASTSASPEHSGNTSIDTSTCSPSGDSLKPLTSSGKSVTGAAVPPPAATRHNWPTPSFAAVKYRLLPSADHAGAETLIASSVMRSGDPPASGTVQIPVTPLFAA